LPRCSARRGCSFRLDHTSAVTGARRTGPQGRACQPRGVLENYRPTAPTARRKPVPGDASSPRFTACSTPPRRAGGQCQACGRPHLAKLRCLPDGRWFDEVTASWRDGQGRSIRWPDLVEATTFRMTRVVLSAAHFDSDPTNNRIRNLKCLLNADGQARGRPVGVA
jgi:hypothetical protein